MTGDILPFDLQGIQEMKPGNSPLVDNSPKNNLEYRTPVNKNRGFMFISSAKSDFFHTTITSPFTLTLLHLPLRRVGLCKPATLHGLNPIKSHLFSK